jgi:hypothetical protein
MMPANAAITNTITVPAVSMHVTRVVANGCRRKCSCRSGCTDATRLLHSGSAGGILGRDAHGGLRDKGGQGGPWGALGNRRGLILRRVLDGGLQADWNGGEHSLDAKGHGGLALGDGHRVRC